jgi:hypothetical protein
MTYAEFKTKLAFYGFNHCETTESGYAELLAIGFTPDDCVNIESDMQAGFMMQESIAAMRRARAQ